MRVADNQRFVVRKRHSWNIFEQVVTVAYHLNHKLRTYYYNTDVCKHPNDYRTGRPEVFRKKGVLRNFAKFTGKHLYQSLFFNEVAGLQAWNFILKNDSGTGLFL